MCVCVCVCVCVCWVYVVFFHSCKYSDVQMPFLECSLVTAFSVSESINREYFVLSKCITKMMGDTIIWP